MFLFFMFYFTVINKYKEFHKSTQKKGKEN